MIRENLSREAAETLSLLKQELKEDEKSDATIEKYMRDAGRFLLFYYDKERSTESAEIEQTKNYAGIEDSKNGTDNRKKGIREVSKEDLIAYKEHLREKGYSPSGINSILAGVRAFLKCIGKEDIKVKNYKVQQQTFADESRMLTKSEYMRMINYCRGDGETIWSNKSKKKSRQKNQAEDNSNSSESNSKFEKAALIMETICSTGIRVSELRFFTVEAVRSGEVNVYLKGKERKVLMSRKLSKRLLAYAKCQDITEGSIFLNGKGEPLHRSQIWQMMKSLCERAGVDKKKVFPHNLRKLFARAFYNVKKDIAKLADVLGHSSINTTRRYIKTIPEEHIRQIERLGLVV